MLIANHENVGITEPPDTSNGGIRRIPAANHVGAL